MAGVINTICNVIIITFTVAMVLHGIYYVATAMQSFRKIPKIPKREPQLRMAIIIPSRNEERVVGNLVDSLKRQNYPKELYDIIVVPNNCTDNTKGVALEHGAKVMDCTVPVKSKGEVLKFVFEKMLTDEPIHYDAFCVFDSDNVVDPEFLQAMNDAFLNGARITQAYRDTKNPSDTWVSSCHSIYYYTINGFFNRARMAMKWSGALNGTGFGIRRDYLEKYGFDTYTLTEDLEYTAQAACVPGELVTWVPDAITYDEHPLTLKESWKQRSRWTTGTIQCFFRYFGKLFTVGIKGGSASIDMLVLFSAPIMQILGLLPFIAIIVNAIVSKPSAEWWTTVAITGVVTMVLFYLFTVIFTWFVVKTEKKDPKLFLKGIFSFSLFLATWMPIAVLAIIKPNFEWKPMYHTRNITLDDIMGTSNANKQDDTEEHEGLKEPVQL